MVVLGVLLLIGAGVFAAAVITSNTDAVGGDLWGLHISNLSLGAVYVAGLLTGLAVLVGLVVLFAGIRRERRLRQERRTLARENARLTKDLGGAPVPGTLPAPGTVPAPAAVPAPDTAAWSAPPVTADEAASRPVVRPEPPADNRPQYDSPPPPSYDRETIEAEAERQQAAEDGAAVRDGDTTAPVDPPVDAPPAGRR